MIVPVRNESPRPAHPGSLSCVAPLSVAHLRRENVCMNGFEVRAARFFGLALPVLETLRRRTDFSEPYSYVDDYIAGGILLWAAWALNRKKWYGSELLIAAWGIVCGGGYYSFFGQISRLGTPDVSGLPSAWVAVIKGAGWAMAMVCLILSVRTAGMRMKEASK